MRSHDRLVNNHVTPLRPVRALTSGSHCSTIAAGESVDPWVTHGQAAGARGSWGKAEGASAGA